MLKVLIAIIMFSIANAVTCATGYMPFLCPATTTTVSSVFSRSRSIDGPGLNAQIFLFGADHFVCC